MEATLHVHEFFAFLCRHITTLLEDVVFFVIGKESTGGLQRPNPLTEEGVIIRERQKLLREQYVLKEIFNLLSIPIKGYGGEHEIARLPYSFRPKKIFRIFSRWLLLMKFFFIHNLFPVLMIA